ncbi:DinB/UmuC family translesion DNA polymerase [Streptomyces bottropensis]|uniref:DinB/UmuC family translesion DNA polymerase n=1 Tax=Streptomyces bottropensis TaxID=42235 RepID=UPI0036985773
MSRQWRPRRRHAASAHSTGSSTTSSTPCSTAECSWLAVELGARLRAAGQIAEGVSVTVSYVDRSATTRSRTLPEATHHTVFLGLGAYAAYETLGLQRARVRGITLRADGLRAADWATRQLALDAQDDKQLLIEAVADRARARFGEGVLYPAALASAPAGRYRSADGIG